MSELSHGVASVYFSVFDSNCSDLFACDALKIPMRSESCDAAICIAVLHHVSNNHRRIALIRSDSRLNSQ